METLGLVHTPGVGTTQVGDLNFASVCKLADGTVLAGGLGGLVTLDTSEYDNESLINAFVEFPRTDFMIPRFKRIRKLSVGFETNGIVEVRFRAEEGEWEKRFVTSNAPGEQLQETEVVGGARSVKGRYFEVRVDNYQGSDFSLDAIDVMLTVLTKK